jgi:hypothetical protein
LTTTEAPVTNITQDMKDAFAALLDGAPNACLFSCFVNGRPTAAICAYEPDKGFSPLFVWITDGMVLTDHDGTAEAEPPEG